MRFVLYFRALLPLFADPARPVVVFEFVIIAILMPHQVRLLHLFIGCLFQHTFLKVGNRKTTQFH